MHTKKSRCLSCTIFVNSNEVSTNLDEEPEYVTIHTNTLLNPKKILKQLRLIIDKIFFCINFSISVFHYLYYNIKIADIPPQNLSLLLRVNI